MALKIGDFFFNLFSTTIEALGETKLDEALQVLHDKDEVQYKAAIFGGLALTQALKPIVEKSNTKIDDTVLNAIHMALVASAAANAVEIPVAVTEPVIDNPTDNTNTST